MGLDAAAYVALFLFSALWIYVQVTRSIPSRLHPRQRPESKSGLQPAWPSNGPVRGNGIDIVFVHGLGSNPDTTWRAREPHEASTSSPAGFVNWVTDFLPNDLPSPLRDDIRVFFYNYDSYWKRDALETRLSHFGNELLEDIDRSCMSATQERCRGLVFVGYSYGGLLVKQALVQAHARSDFSYILERTKSILFLGTPHRGSSFSSWGSLVARLLQPIGANPLMLANLDYDSTSLCDLHELYAHICRGNWRVYNFFEKRRTLLLQLWSIRWSQLCVVPQSATYEGPNVRNRGLPVDHSGLNKFESRTDAYEAILASLMEACTHSWMPTERHYIVSRERSHTYVHRADLVAEFERKIQVSPAVVVNGMGGVGKSQMALDVAQRHRDRYNPTLWIDATDEETARSSFYACARELKLSEGLEPGQGPLAHDPRIQAVLRWFRSRNADDDEWLVIIDNADEPIPRLKHLIPTGSRRVVVVTSRDMDVNKLIKGPCERIHVGDMSAEEGSLLLIHHLQLKAETVPESIKTKCYHIAQELGYMALAIDIARATISSDPLRDPEIALSEYIADHRAHRDELLKENKFQGLLSTDQTVWTVWNTTFARMTTAENGEGNPVLLLSFLALFKGDVIQDELFRLAALGIASVEVKLGDESAIVPADLRKFIAVDEGGWDNFRYRQDRNMLARFGLLQRVEGQQYGSWSGSAMHKLVQWRASQDYYPELRWGHMIFVVAACCQFQEEEKHEFRRLLVVQLLEILKEITETMHIAGRDLSVVLPVLATFLFKEGQWADAEKLQVQVVESRKIKLREDHPSTLTSIANLAAIYKKQG